MSFGFSVGDVRLLGQLAWKTVQSIGKACGEDDEHTKEVSNLHFMLLRLEWEVESPASPINRGAEDIRDELLSIISGCEKILDVLAKIFDKYEYNAPNMEDRSRRMLWQKIRLDDGQTIDLAELRKNVKYYTLRLSIFLSMLSIGIIGRGSTDDGMDEARRSLIPPASKLALNDVVARCLSGIASEFLAHTDFMKDDALLWDDLQTELLGEGYPESAISEHMDLIRDSVRLYLFDNNVMGIQKDEGGGDPDLRYAQEYRSDEIIAGLLGVNTSTAYPLQRMTVQSRDEPFQSESWLPFSELAVGPHTQKYSNLRQSLTLRFRRFTRSIRTCHIFIFLGFLTILGSLVPAIWRSVARNDISGGFSLAQYILGVGVFVIGCMVAVHSKNCTCWK